MHLEAFRHAQPSCLAARLAVLNSHDEYIVRTIANEVSVDPALGVVAPLHNSLMRSLGITLTEIAQLDPLAADCAEEGQWAFLYTAAPLKVVGGTGAAVNLIVIK